MAMMRRLQAALRRRTSFPAQSGAGRWTEAQFLFETIGEDELVDPTLTPETLLYRLFHEQGVRLFPARPLQSSGAFAENFYGARRITRRAISLPA